MKTPWSKIMAPILVFLLLAGARTLWAGTGRDAVQAGFTAAAGAATLGFQPNHGQTDSRVKFLSRGPGYRLFLGASDILMRLDPPAAGAAAPADFLRIQWAGGDPGVRLIGENALPGRVNYIKGRNPKDWVRNVPAYERVRYQSVLPGVDLVCYGAREALEYDLILAAGVDPGTIRLAFSGMTRLSLTECGDLALDLASGRIVQRAPIAYQTVDGQKRTVDCRYVLLDPNQVGVRVADYDPTRPLVIDPVVDYSSYLGGAGSDEGLSVAYDGAGAVYVAGYTSSADFPTAGPYQAAIAGGSADAFVVKLDPADGHLIYATYLGGDGHDRIEGIAVDAAGAAYLTGQTDSTDFPTFNGGQLVRWGASDAFVVKLSPDGSTLNYSTYYGGGASDGGYGIAVDAAGMAVVTGYTNSFNYPTKNGYDTVLSGIRDVFVAKFDPTQAAAASLLYSTFLGGSGNGDIGHDVALDAAGCLYVVGSTDSNDFPTLGAVQAALGGGQDAFVAKIDPAQVGAASLIYSTYLGGSGDESGMSVAVDAAGAAHVAGYTNSLDFPTAQPYQAALAGADALEPGDTPKDDAFVAKLAPSGAALAYATYLGGTAYDYAVGLALDGQGNAYVVGYCNSMDFPDAGPYQALYGGGALDGFLTKIDPAGSELLYSTLMGGSDEDLNDAVAVDADGRACVTGRTKSQNYPADGLQTAFGGGASDGFVVVMNANPDTRPPSVFSTSPADYATDVPLTAVFRVVFSEDMDPATINTDTFKVYIGYSTGDAVQADATPISGTVTYDQVTRTAEFNPSGELVHMGWYVAVIGLDARDVSGNGMPESFQFNIATVAGELGGGGGGGCFVSTALDGR